MVSASVVSRYYLDLNEGEEGNEIDNEEKELLEGADWAKSTAVRSRFDSKHFGKACQVIRALRNPKKKLLRPLFESDEDRILTYELTVSILKYASFLNQALDASEFYKRNPNYKKENNEDVLVVLYDLFEREFQVHRHDPVLSRKFSLLQQAVLGVKTKIMAHLARLRIQYQATTVNHLLPENLRHQKHIDQNPIYAWVNLKKAKLPLVLTALFEIGLQQSEFEDDILIQEDSFYVDVSHNDLMRFHSSRKDTIFNSTLVRDGLLVVQDKSACISVYAMVKALFFKENLNRDRKLPSANLFGTGGSGVETSRTMYGTYLGVPISIPPIEEWYENILETTNKKESKPDCIIVTHGGSCRSVAHLACLLQESVPKWLSRNTEMSSRDDLATAISNKFIPRPPLNVVAFGVPVNKQEEISRFFRKQMQLHNVRLCTEDFMQISPRDPRVKNACAILVNPPSSGSALKDPVAYICTEGGDEDVLVHLSKFVHTQTSPEATLKYTSSQSKFLKHALNFTQAKLVLYTTCSLLQVENSDVVNGAIADFHEELDEDKSQIFNEILYEKKPIRFYKDISLELIPLGQLLETYNKQNFNGPFMEMPPSSASSGCFMALIRKKEVVISIEKNHVKNILSNHSESPCSDHELAVSTDGHSTINTTLTMNSALMGEAMTSTDYGNIYVNSSLLRGNVILNLAPFTTSTTNSTRSSRSAGGESSRMRKRSMTKKAIVQRVSIPTHASLAKQTRKWAAENKDRQSSSGRPKETGPGGVRLNYVHSPSCKGNLDEQFCMCHVCARHAKKFPDLFRPRQQQQQINVNFWGAAQSQMAKDKNKAANTINIPMYSKDIQRNSTTENTNHKETNLDHGQVNQSKQTPPASPSIQSQSIFDDTSTTEEEDDIPDENENTSTTFVLSELMELSELSQEVDTLFDLVAMGQLTKVKNFLNQMAIRDLHELSKQLTIEGDTIFHTAIRRQDEAMMELLLSEIPHLENVFYDILLLSIKESSIEIAQKIIRAIDKYKGNSKYSLTDLPRWPNSEFDDHITPIMLAAMVGNYDLIALFASRKQELFPELTYKVTSSGRPKRRTKNTQFESKQSSVEKFLCCCLYDSQGAPEDLSEDYQRLHEYQAITSPEMLCFQANTIENFDPLLKCFQYIQELEYVKERETEFYEHYEELIVKLRHYAVQLLSICSSSQELDILLSRQEGYHARHDRYPRIVMAMEMQLTEFVSHPHTQRTLYTEWAGQYWNEWRYFSTPQKWCQFFSRIIFLPLFLLFLCGEQGNKQGKLLASPINRCFYECISQIIFICLAISEHVLELAQPNERTPPNFYIEIVMALFVFGQIRALGRQFCFAPKAFFRETWNWYDMINYILYCFCFVCWLILYSPHYLMHPILPSREPIERQYWNYYDPLLIADVFLTLGTIMAFGKLLRYVQLHSVIGPLQVALGKMIKNITNFIIFFLVVFAAFCLGITIIYAPYRGMKNEGTDEYQNDVFTKPLSTLTEMYWNLFGLASSYSDELITLAVPQDEDPNHTENYEHYITEVAGKSLFSIYAFFGPTILFSSMLVAFISNTFGKILEENDTNWKFHRAQIWVYFSRASVMPPPFNLFPTVWDFTSIFRTIRNVKKYPNKYLFTCNCATCFHSDLKQSQKEKKIQEEMYFNLIKVLIQRYFRSKTELASRVTATSEDIASLNEEVDELKELIHQRIQENANKNTGGGGDDDGGGASIFTDEKVLTNPPIYSTQNQPPYNLVSGIANKAELRSKSSEIIPQRDFPSRKMSAPVSHPFTIVEPDATRKEKLENRNSVLKIPTKVQASNSLATITINAQVHSIGSNEMPGLNEDQEVSPPIPPPLPPKRRKISTMASPIKVGASVAYGTSKGSPSKNIAKNISHQKPSVTAGGPVSMKSPKNSKSSRSEVLENQLSAHIVLEGPTNVNNDSKRDSEMQLIFKKANLPLSKDPTGFYDSNPPLPSLPMTQNGGAGGNVNVQMEQPVGTVGQEQVESVLDRAPLSKNTKDSNRNESLKKRSE